MLPDERLLPQDRWAWVEVDLEAIKKNARAWKSFTQPPTRFCAVVKANAYGHGSVRVAQALRSVGVDMFAVATVAEGVRLREGGITEPIIMLAQPPISSVGTLVEHRIMPAVYDLEFLGRLSEEALAQGTKARYHLAIDTGMDRIGVAPDCAAEFMRMADKLLGVEVDGTFTHFATADRITDWDFTVQARRFQNAVASICAAGIDPGIVHCANTPTTVLHPEYHFDMVRVGVGLYGLHPADTTRDKLELTQAMSVRARVTRAVQPNVGEGVGYGMTYRIAHEGTQVCTIPVGYADGIDRRLGCGRMSFSLNGRRVPTIGNICMDMCMLDVTGVEASVGDTVTIFGDDPDVTELAKVLDTIPYEIMTSVPRRIERVILRK